jgi:ABC-type multidrug transport system fused ATPase/permease subunit
LKLRNIDTVKSGINYKVADFIYFMVRGMACLLLALIVAWKFTIVFLAIIPFMILCTSIMTSLIKKYTKREYSSYELAGKIANEVFGSIRTVLSLGIQRKMVSKYGSCLTEAEQMTMTKGLITGIFNGMSNFLFNSLFAIGIYYGVYLNQLDCIGYGPARIVTAFFSVINTTFSFGQALPFLKDLAEAQGAAVQVFKMVDTRSLIDMFDDYDKMTKKKLIDLRGEIEFKDVHFSYPTRRKSPVLAGFSLKIEAGKTVAIVGSR